MPQTPYEKMLEQFEVNVFGPMEVMRAIRPRFRAEGNVNCDVGLDALGIARSVAGCCRIRRVQLATLWRRPADATPDDWRATFLEPSKVTTAQQSYLGRPSNSSKSWQAGDTVIIGAPMYNVSIRALLKAWIDQVVRLAQTWGCGPTGPPGLLRDEKVIVVTARGGAYEKGTSRRFWICKDPIRSTFWHASALRRDVHSCRERLGERNAASFAEAQDRVGGILADL